MKKIQVRHQFAKP